MGYLSLVIKEGLRMYPSSIRSHGYITKESVEIAGVEVPAGQIMYINLLGAHYNTEQWKEPMRFVPDRFDPESEWFLTPSGKPRHPLSYIPFSFGTYFLRVFTFLKL